MKRNYFAIGITMVLLLVSYVDLKAQSGDYIKVRDFESWTSATLSYKINKKFKVGLGQELRLKDNSSVVDQYFTNGFLKYDLFKPLTLGTEFRYIRKNDNIGNIQGYENHFRYALQATFKQDISRLSLKYRLQFQNRNELGLSSTNESIPVQKLRFKLGGTYNIPKWKLDPELSVEMFRTLGDFNDFSKIRTTIGTEYKIKKSGTIKFYYRFEKELNTTYPLTSHIIGLNYEFTFKRKTK